MIGHSGEHLLRNVGCKTYRSSGARTGAGIVIAKAREVLVKEFPELAGRNAVCMPDEKSRRVRQAVAAASLPEVNRALK